jgi:hypothetical protein
MVSLFAALLEQQIANATCQYGQPDQREPQVQGVAVHRDVPGSQRSLINRGMHLKTVCGCRLYDSRQTIGNVGRAVAADRCLQQHAGVPARSGNISVAWRTNVTNGLAGNGNSLCEQQHRPPYSIIGDFIIERVQP